MPSFAIATPSGLLIVRDDGDGTVEQHLTGSSPDSLAVDLADPDRLYVGSRRDGLWRSQDAGRSWEPVGAGIPHPNVTAVAVEAAAGGKPAAVFAGTEPSTLSCSQDGGDSWQSLDTLLALPSASHWSFPPKPQTHHVRWIETDPHHRGGLYVAIEAGALVRSWDGGETWLDRVAGGPIDTHTAAAHPRMSGRVYSAAGDGYFESEDGGDSWRRPMEGLRHRYLVGVAVDPGDPATVVVSAASGPYRAYRPRDSEGYLYRRRGNGPFEPSMTGLPSASGTIASRLATHPQLPGAIFAANNHGLFRTRDGGRSWQQLSVRWPQGVFDRGVRSLAILAL